MTTKMNGLLKGFVSAMLLTSVTTLQAATTPGVPMTKGQACTFQDNVIYSALVINSRINDFKANTNASQNRLLARFSSSFFIFLIV